MDEKNIDKLDSENFVLKEMIRTLPFVEIAFCFQCRGMSNGATYICRIHTEKLCQTALKMLPILCPGEANAT